MWNMLSDGVKDGNDNNKARYISELSRTDSFRLTIEIKHVKITGDEAVVTLFRRGRIDTALDPLDADRHKLKFGHKLQ